MPDMNSKLAMLHVMQYRLQELEDELHKDSQMDLDKELSVVFALPAAMYELEKEIRRSGFRWKSVMEVWSAALGLAREIAER